MRHSNHILLETNKLLQHDKEGALRAMLSCGTKYMLVNKFKQMDFYRSILFPITDVPDRVNSIYDLKLIDYAEHTCT